MGEPSVTSTALTVPVSPAAPLATAYWTGGYSPANNYWGASNGSSLSNWVAMSGGIAQGLVPGASTNVVFTGINEGNAYLGANMSVAGITIASGDGSNLQLQPDGNTLTIGSGGISHNGGNWIAFDVPLVLSAPQTWAANNQSIYVNGPVANGGNALTLAGGQNIYINGSIGGGGGLSINNTNNVYLYNANAYTGPTVLNAGNLQLTAGTGSTGSLYGSSAIIFNGGNMTLVNSTSDATASRLSATAPITSYGGGALQFQNSSNSNVYYQQSYGTLTAAGGQFNLYLQNNQNQTNNTQTVTLSGLNPSGAGVVTFSGPGSMPNTTTNVFQVSGATATPSGQIIGPWATIGSGTGNQTDYAVYNATGQIVAANITGTSDDSTWTNPALAYTMGNGGGTNITLSGNRTIAALRDNGNNDTLNLGQYTLATNGLLNGGQNQWTINAGTGALTQNAAGAGNLYVTAGNQSITINASIADNAGPLTLVKSGNQNLTLAGANSFSGGVVLNQGTTYVNSPTALGTGTLVFAGGNIDVQIGGNYLTMTNVNNNPVTIDANFLYNGSNQTNLNLGNGAVSLGTTPGTNRTIYVNSGVLTLGGAIGNGTTANSLTKANGGTLLLAGANTFTGATTVASGTLILSAANSYAGGTTITSGALVAENAGALGSGSVTVAANAALDYAANADAPLAIGGTLSIAGASSTVIGGAIGSTPTSAEINVTGPVTATPGTVLVNVYGVNGTAAGASGSYTLLHSGNAASSVYGATAYNLNLVYDNTNFTVGAPLASATDLTVPITVQTALTNAYWKGGLSNAGGVWAASNGSSQSNWVATSGGANQPLVPGPATNLIFSNSSVLAKPERHYPGANMTVNSLTQQDTGNQVVLNNDGSVLTIAPASSATGITINSGAQAMTIYANMVLGAAQTWTNNSGNALSVYGNISGAGGLTKQGSGPLYLGGANSYNGGTTVAAGTLQLKAANGLSTAGPLTVEGGVMDFGGFTVTTTAAVSFQGGVTQNGTIVNNGSAYDGQSGTVSAILQGAAGLNKTTAGTLLLSGSNNTYAGGTSIANGTLQVGAAPSYGHGALPNSTTVTFGSATTNGTLDLNGYSTVISGLSVAAGASPASQIVGNSSTSSNSTLNVDPIGNVSTTFGGTIQDTLGSGNKTTGLYVGSNATLTLTGSSTYTGTTSVDGTLIFGPGGGLGNTPVTIAGTLGTAQTGGGATIAGGSTLNLGSGSTLNMQDSNCDVLAFSGAGTITGVSSPATLKFDVGSGTSDLLTFGGAATVSGTVDVAFAAAGSLANGTYTLATAGGGGLGSGYTLNNLTTTLSGHTLALSTDANDILLTVSGSGRRARLPAFGAATAEPAAVGPRPATGARPACPARRRPLPTTRPTSRPASRTLRSPWTAPPRR